MARPNVQRSSWLSNTAGTSCPGREEAQRLISQGFYAQSEVIVDRHAEWTPVGSTTAEEAKAMKETPGLQAKVWKICTQTTPTKLCPRLRPTSQLSKPNQKKEPAMADCSDLEVRLKAAKERLAAAKKLKRPLTLAAAAAAAGRSKPLFRTLSMQTEPRSGLTRRSSRQVEADNLALGEIELKKLVQANFDKSVKPQGSKGLNINYSLMDASEESVAELLEVIGVRRRVGIRQRPDDALTEGVAQDALISQIA